MLARPAYVPRPITAEPHFGGSRRRKHRLTPDWLSRLNQSGVRPYPHAPPVRLLSICRRVRRSLGSADLRSTGSILQIDGMGSAGLGRLGHVGSDVRYPAHGEVTHALRRQVQPNSERTSPIRSPTAGSLTRSGAAPNVMYLTTNVIDSQLD
jgi:hypothetical protein